MVDLHFRVLWVWDGQKSFQSPDQMAGINLWRHIGLYIPSSSDMSLPGPWGHHWRLWELFSGGGCDKRSFSAVALCLWNSPTSEAHLVPTLTNFLCQVKMSLFFQIFVAWYYLVWLSWNNSSSNDYLTLRKESSSPIMCIVISLVSLSPPDIAD